MSIDKLRAEIVEAMGRHRRDEQQMQREHDQLTSRLLATRAQISTLQDVLGSIDEMEEEPVPTGTTPPQGTGRAPRRDVQGAIKQAVRDYMEAKGLGPRLDDVVIGAGILLESDITESACLRALHGLVAKGELFAHGDRYAPVGRPTDKIKEGLTEALAVAKGEAEPYRVTTFGEAAK